MNFNKVCAVYFSATGTTKKIVESIAETIAGKLGVKYDTCDFTLPNAREKALRFHESDIIVFGTPVYAGRVPNVLLKYLNSIEGNDAIAVPVVLYGNRDYDDALIELRDILEKGGLHTVAAAAFIGEHSFSYVLAKDRPDEEDMQKAKEFAAKVAEKIKDTSDMVALQPVEVNGIPYPYRGYYQPKDRNGNPIDIRKVKPLTSDDCINCLICADVCPMGSISRDNVREFTGICIKCGACIKKCPTQAKYYVDEGFLYHKRELEEGLTRRAEPEWFV
ncbi:MAG TPA: EFR1 family ferrodoxin [Bacillota bacterium]|jgi:ferredoxin|nr:EFR1 family ferrodoxin [Bacillota bacterium]HPZ60096.1 EFR1 family ferrodoxin [Bacillota bacterium]